MDRIPIEFEEIIRHQWGDHQTQAFIQSLELDPPTSIQYNRAKGTGPLFVGEQVPWNPLGQYLPTRPSFTLDPHFHAGRYYVQEAGSMFLAYLMVHIQKENEIKTALDLSAAPGGKTTILLNALSPDSILVANEVIHSRYNILRQNLAKWGQARIVATQADPSHFSTLSGAFNLVVTDVPCSGEGLFRKQPEARTEWSLNHVDLCVARQKRILADAWPLVAPGGYLLYSTCTYNQQENDQNVGWLLEQGPFDSVSYPIPEAWGVLPTQYGYQFAPHRTRSEGFFVAVLKRQEDSVSLKPKRNNKQKPKFYYQPLDKQLLSIVSPWMENPDEFHFWCDPKGQIYALPMNQQEWIQRLHPFKRWVPGTPVGIIKGKSLIPDHALALSIHLHKKKVPKLAMDREQALAFLRKQPQARLDWPDVSPGWHLVTFEGHGLGWVKVLPNRINNYLPTDWRIRM